MWDAVGSALHYWPALAAALDVYWGLQGPCNCCFINREGAERPVVDAFCFFQRWNFFIFYKNIWFKRSFRSNVLKTVQRLFCSDTSTVIHFNVFMKALFAVIFLHSISLWQSWVEPGVWLQLLFNKGFIMGKSLGTEEISLKRRKLELQPLQRRRCRRYNLQGWSSFVFFVPTQSWPLLTEATQLQGRRLLKSHSGRLKMTKKRNLFRMNLQGCVQNRMQKLYDI